MAQTPLNGQTSNQKAIFGWIKLEIFLAIFFKFILPPKFKFVECALLLYLWHKVTCCYVFVEGRI